MEKIKILIIGEQKSGKSVIANYLYQDNRQTPRIYRPTIGLRVLEFERRMNINSQDKLIQVSLWDISGNLEYESTWNVPQDNADGIIICANGDNNHHKEEVEGWINSFPKKMKLPPSNCIGFLNHPSGIISTQQTQIQISSVVFHHSCFERRGLTIGPVFDKFIEKIVQNRMIKNEQIQLIKILSYNELNLFENLTYTKPSTFNRVNDIETFIVDYGSFYAKAGSIYDELPTLLCKSKTLKTKRNNQAITISGNQITSEYYKIQSKKIIDNGVIQQKELEDFNDYVFENFQVNKGDRLLYTEPLGVSLKQRSVFFEQFFELYELQEVLPCVDSIAASFQTLNQHSTNTGLVISIGHNKTTILPFINSDLNVSRVREIDVGVRKMKNALMKLFDVKYKNFNNLFNPKFGNGFYFYQKNAFIAQNYDMQLQYYLQREQLENPNVQRPDGIYGPIIVQPYQQHNYILSEQEIRQLEQKRQEQAQKLLKIKEQKRQEKNEKMRQQLQNMEELLQQDLDEDQIIQNGYQSEDDLKKKIKIFKIKLGLISKEELNKNKFNLVDVPDDQLSPEQRRAKQYQIMHKKAEIKRQEKRRKRDIEKKRINELIERNPGKYLDELKSKRQKLKKKIKKIKMYKEDNFLKRQKEQKIIENLDNHLEGNEQIIQNKQLKKFYENIMEVSSDCEIYEKKVKKIEEDIQQIDPTFDPYADDQSIYLQRKYMRPNFTYIGTDIIRSTEALFKPYLIGSKQKGLLESIKCSLKSLNDESLQKLMSNVFVIGGGSNIQGIGQRIQNDLHVNFSYRGVKQVNLQIVENPLYLPYQGMRQFWLGFEDQFKQNCVYTKQEYDEYGPQLFKSCPIGNWQLNYNIQLKRIMEYEIDNKNVSSKYDQQTQIDLRDSTRFFEAKVSDKNKKTIPFYLKDKSAFKSFYDKNFFKSIFDQEEFLNICGEIFDLLNQSQNSAKRSNIGFKTKKTIQFALFLLGVSTLMLLISIKTKDFLLF